MKNRTLEDAKFFIAQATARVRQLDLTCPENLIRFVVYGAVIERNTIFILKCLE